MYGGVYFPLAASHGATATQDQGALSHVFCACGKGDIEGQDAAGECQRDSKYARRVLVESCGLKRNAAPHEMAIEIANARARAVRGICPQYLRLGRLFVTPFTARTACARGASWSCHDSCICESSTVVS